MWPAVLSSALTRCGSGHVEVRARVLEAEIDGLLVRLDERGLLRERLLDELDDDVAIELEQRGEHADVRHVLHENARARVREPLVAHARERHADDLDVGARQEAIARPSRVVEQHAAGRDLLQVARVRLRVHRDHDVDGARAREIAVLADPDLVPGRQALDVRREEILAADRDRPCGTRSSSAASWRSRSRCR